jgi:hypothetical protein
MSSVYTPTPAQLGNITLPSDLDARNAASINTPLQAIADGLASFSAPLASLAALAALAAPADGNVRHVLGNGLYVFKTSATAGLSPFRVAASDATPGGWVASNPYQTTLTRFLGMSNFGVPWITNTSISPVLSVVGPKVPATSAQVFSYDQAITFQVVDTGSAIARGLIFGISDLLIDGATIASCTLSLWGAFSGPSHASLPALMPKFGILRISSAGAGVALLSTGGGLVTDTAASVGVYESQHDVVFTPDQNNIVDKSQYSYSLIVFNEGHTNAQGVLGITGIQTVQNVPDARRS